MSQAKNPFTLKRRTLLKGGAAITALSTLPAFAKTQKPKTLVLIELAGGNDSLNMICPIHDAEYHRARPRLGLKEHEHIPLVKESANAPALSLHKSLKELAPLFERKELGLLLGLGYPTPNRSHFRSIDVWNSASLRDSDEGWVKRVLESRTQHTPSFVDGLVFGRGGEGPLLQLSKVLVVENPASLRPRKTVATSEQNPSDALAHVLNTQAQLGAGTERLRKALKKTPFKARFPKSPLAHSLARAAHALAAGVSPSVIKIQHGGFDTHKDQRNTQARLLAQLSQGLSAFREALIAAGKWNEVVVMTYSEFGRRVRENGSGGTDHGTAASHLVMGGGIRGGILGTMPSLKTLQKGDLIHTTDFRSVLYGLSRDLFDAKNAAAHFGKVKPLSLV